MTRAELIALTDLSRKSLPSIEQEETRVSALRAIAKALVENEDTILKANAYDVSVAREKGVREAMIDRLSLTKEKLATIAEAVNAVADLPSPTVLDREYTHKNGMIIRRYRVPLGVVGMIYEARPNVTVDAAALCLRSGNACLLRGGSEAFASNKALVSVMREAIASVGVDENAVTILEDLSHETVDTLLSLRGHIDLVIPRGGKGLIRRVVENAAVPVIETGAGNCHVYVHESADIPMAVRILDNAKTQRPSVCNAAETLLCDEKIAKDFLPLAKKALDLHNVEWRGCEKTCAILNGIAAATEEDYDTEYNDYVLSVKVVSDVDEAIAHIARYSTRHSECIVAENEDAVKRFFSRVDASTLYHNASTRFTDGGEFGLGAEIGISTQKLHARGPFALEALTTTQYRVYGNGETR